mmetsp:Transcript_54482/g.74775  ORF Transcript_54482/g.74775 Transcript_54482/m.74775 type:complete len:91 (+) Transcript_54482:118-390(+)
MWHKHKDIARPFKDAPISARHERASTLRPQLLDSQTTLPHGRVHRDAVLAPARSRAICPLRLKASRGARGAAGTHAEHLLTHRRGGRAPR